MRKFFTDRTAPTPTSLAGKYDAYATTWLQRESKLENRLVTEAWRDDMVQRLRGDVLEIGVAAGDTLMRFGRYDHHVTSYTGVDLSPGMIEQARTAASGITVPTTLMVANAEDLSVFADHQFDTVTASLVFCTIPDVPKALAEIARVCKTDGQIVLIEHVLSPNPLVAFFQRLFSPAQVRMIGCHLDRPTVHTLQQHGYHLLEHRRRLFGVIRFIVASPPHPR